MRFLKRRGTFQYTPVLVFILLFGVLASPVRSQVYLTDQYSTVYAITNAKIVTGSGTVIINGSVLLRNGLISAVGEAVDIPAEAKVIDGTGLTIYPGFIDLSTNLGFKPAPASDRRGRPATTGSEEEKEEPKTRKFDNNLRPDRVAVDIIDMSDEKIAAAREAGITAAVSIPSRGVFPGKGSLVVTCGDDPLTATVKPETFQFIQYANERGGYPSTLFAVVAFQRQKLIDAQYFMQRENEFSRNPRGSLNAMKKRITYDPVLKKLFPIVTGSEKVVIVVEKENDIKRAVELAHFENMFNLNYILSGVTEGYRVIDLLKKERVPVIVSLDFPAAKNTTGYSFNLPIKPYEPPAPPGEKSKKKKDEKSEIEKMIEEQVHGNAAVLYESGIPFVLSAGGKFKDFHKNLRLAVKAGLPAEVAMAKITREPAAMLGLEDIMGTVELGKLANLVVTKGCIFADTTKVKMVFIDGKMFEIKEPEKPTGNGVAGTWDFSIESPEGSMPGTLELEVSGTTVTGSLSTNMGIAEIIDGKIEGDTLTLTLDLQGMIIEMTGTVSGDSISGTADVAEMGSMSWSAKRPGRRAI